MVLFLLFFLWKDGGFFLFPQVVCISMHGLGLNKPHKVNLAKEHLKRQLAGSWVELFGRGIGNVNYQMRWALTQTYFRGTIIIRI